MQIFPHHCALCSYDYWGPRNTPCIKCLMRKQFAEECSQCKGRGGDGWDIFKKFLRYWHRNPTTYVELRDRALLLLRSGEPRFNVAYLIESFRKDERTDDDVDKILFKIPNEFAPYYSRILMRYNTELMGVFELRTSLADKYLIDGWEDLDPDNLNPEDFE